jgi:hypothetical protein
MITNDARYTREIKSKISLGKAADFLQRKFGIRDETSKVVHSEQNFERCLKLDTLVGISEISGKYGYVVLEKDGEDHMV